MHKNDIPVQKNKKKNSGPTDPTQVSQPSKKDAIFNPSKKKFNDEITPKCESHIENTRISKHF